MACSNLRKKNSRRFQKSDSSIFNNLKFYRTIKTKLLLFISSCTFCYPTNFSLRFQKFLLHTVSAIHITLRRKTPSHLKYLWEIIDLECFWITFHFDDTMKRSVFQNNTKTSRHTYVSPNFFVRCAWVLATFFSYNEIATYHIATWRSTYLHVSVKWYDNKIHEHDMNHLVTKIFFLFFFSVAGPIKVYFKIPVSEISKIDDQRSVRKYVRFID